MSTCRWCTPRGQTTVQFLLQYCSGELSSQEVKAANEDLCYCLECVVEYHQARDEVHAKHKALCKLETKRLIDHFENALKAELEDDELFLIENEQEIQLCGYTGPDLENNLRVPILEILKYPYLLLDEGLSQLCIEALTKMEKVNFSFQAFDKHPGIYLLLVHPNETVRKWAILTARSLGKVERDDFYDLQEVITCLLRVIELDLFENSDIYNSVDTETTLILLPPHLYDITNHKNYWLGICMLFMVLDEQAMDSLLLAQDKQNDFMNSILNTMKKSEEDDTSDPFWPALQCFMVILDRLGSKVWGQLIDPMEAFQTITGSHSYNKEIENIRNNVSSKRIKSDLDDGDGDYDDNLVSCSQIVYDYNTKRQNKDTGWKNAICPDYYPNMYDEMQTLVHVLQCDIGQDMRVHNSTFLWFIPFVNSVMDLKNLGVVYIGEVVHHIHSEIKDVLDRKVNSCDKVAGFFILIMVCIVELHRNKKNLHMLWYSSQKWVDMLVKCANLPAWVFNQNKEKAGTPGNCRITSTSLAAKSSGVCSSVTNSVQQACVQLVRCFLREGCQSQQRGTSQQFLDKLNLQLRNTFILGWQLSHKEQQELKTCLIEIVKLAKNQVSEVKQPSRVGRGGVLPCSLIKQEKVERSVCERITEYCNSGPEPPDSAVSRSITFQSNVVQEKPVNSRSVENLCEVPGASESSVEPAMTPVHSCDSSTFPQETSSAKVSFDIVTDDELREMFKETSDPVRKESLGDPHSKYKPAAEHTDSSTRGSGPISHPEDNGQIKPLPSTDGAEPMRESTWRLVSTKIEDDHVGAKVPTLCNSAQVIPESPHKANVPCAKPEKSNMFKLDRARLLHLNNKMKIFNRKTKMDKEEASSPRKESTDTDCANSRVGRGQSGGELSDWDSNLKPKEPIRGGDCTPDTSMPHQEQTLASVSADRRKSPNSDGTLSSKGTTDPHSPKTSCASPKPGQCSPSRLDDDDDDDSDIPFDALRIKLKKRHNVDVCLLTNSEINRDLTRLSLAASSKCANFSDGLTQESCVMQFPETINRKVKGSFCVQKGEIPKSSSFVHDLTTNENRRIIVADSHSPNLKGSTVKLEACDAKNPDGIGDSIPGTTHSEGNKASNHGTSDTTFSKHVSHPKESVVFEEDDSQFFEFETEEEIYSVWEDTQPQEGQATVAKVTVVEPSSTTYHQPGYSDVDLDILNEWGYDTDYATDEMIEKVASRAELHLEQPQPVLRMSSSSSGSTTDEEDSDESHVNKSEASHAVSAFYSASDLLKGKHREKNILTSDPNRKGFLLPGENKQKLVSANTGAPKGQLAKKLPVKQATGESRKSDTFSLPLSKAKEKSSLQVKARDKYSTQASPRKDLSKFSPSEKKANSSAHSRKGAGNVCPSSNARHSSLEGKSSGGSFTTGFKSPSKDLQTDKPSDKPPLSLQQKKVRKRPEPTSLVEKLGLKKKTRKAFDLSQGSLDSLNELRNYGQAKGTIEHTRSKKTKLISPQKLTTCKNLRLLASQDRQYLRQAKHSSTLKKRKETKKGTVSHPRSSQLLPTEEAGRGSSFSFSSMSENHSGHFTSREKHSNPTMAITVSVEFRSVGSQTGPAPRNLYCMIGDEDNDHHDFNLTQHDPVDKDLDNENQEDVDAFNLTQRDPVDMDLDSEDAKEEGDHGNSKEEAGCQQLEHADPSVNAEILKKKQPPLPGPKSDVVFATPALPVSLSKSSRATTSKRFASSSTSRNAQLASEMEMLPNCKIKQVGKPLLPKPAESKLLVSRPFPFPKPVPTTNILRALKGVNAMASASPPAMPTRTPPSYAAQPHVRFKPLRDPLCLKVDLADRQNRDASYLIKDVLKWTYQMFDSLSQFGPPDCLCEFAPREVPQKFSSYEEYFRVYYPLMMLNTFEQLAKEWTESRQSHRLIQNSLTLKNHWVQEQIYRAEFQVSLHDTNFNKHQQPKEDDVVFLWLLQSHIPYLQDEMVDGTPEVHLGHISRASYSSDGRGSTLHLSVQTRGNVSAVKSQPIKCEVIGSLVTTIRQFKALLFLHKTPLALPVISISSPFFTQRDLVDDAKWSSANEYNEFQQRAINVAYTMVKQHSRIPKICLIQGPPGTGKSKTIVGFLHRLLNEEEENVEPVMSRNPRTKRTRILVCAPSNAAIDDLMKKIILDFKSKSKDKNNCLGNCGDVNLVRLGLEKSISSDVVKFSLDYQVDYKIKKNQPGVDQQIQWRKQYLDKRLDELGRQCAIMKKHREQIVKLTEERRKLDMERQKLGRTMKEHHRQMQDVQLNIILESHIICCTLSTSGGGLLEMAFRKLGHEPFSCVVVDEAGQSCESETLIPLVYRCPKLILLGDPEQLPPTIISMKARGFGYGRSMMQRLQKGLYDDVKQSGVRQQPHVLELLTQYRMHPDICLFPSKHIYGGKLKTNKTVEMQRCSLSWPFEPYMLFDVIDGCEIRKKGSFSNLQEVKLVIALITLIAEQQKGKCNNIAVITPYNAQKQEIQNQIEQACRKGLDQGRAIQVGTVDGFQGCEKDCIIVTCVRANNQQANIGFLADRQRLNVTITRARFSLFILGHLKTLTDSKDWNALIQDAQRRGAIVKTCESDYRKDCRKVMKPRPAFQRALSVQGTGDRKAVPELLRRASIPMSCESTKRVEQTLKPPAPSLPVDTVHPQPGPAQKPADDRPRDPRLARKLGAQTKDVGPQLEEASTRWPNPPDAHTPLASRGQRVPRPSLPGASCQAAVGRRNETSSSLASRSCASAFGNNRDNRDRHRHSHSARPQTQGQEAKRRRDDSSAGEQGYSEMKRKRK
ncbi:LOW QUALITY PROTEIN: probable helicase senataxin [Callorhinchus milii]|uniref:LOW QUALITY PROTEIN: probable helicase senataxin n=1 Tax=Callorhinchus milii TaxID=7868 RepID=UPI001C3F6EF1|nr:LOW QUALITY PROTEIN: probable helicase senataxin [Callorhinchus milii]